MKERFGFLKSLTTSHIFRNEISNSDLSVIENVTCKTSLKYKYFMSILD